MGRPQFLDVKAANNRPSGHRLSLGGEFSSLPPPELTVDQHHESTRLRLQRLRLKDLDDEYAVILNPHTVPGLKTGACKLL